MALPKQYEFLTLGNKRPHQSHHLLTGKWVLITGATSGIGLASVHRFAKGQANLILFARDTNKLASLKREIEQTYANEVDTYVADFSDLEQLAAAIQSMKANHHILHILINNAGVYSTKRTLTKHGYELALTVNHLASLMLTQACVPLLERQPGSRIIQVNSEGHRFSGFPINDPHFTKRRYTGLKSYGASKSAQLHTVWALAPTLAKKAITLIAMHPGAVQSKIGLNNGWVYRTFKKWILNLFLKKVTDASDALYYLASDPNVQANTGQYYYLTRPTQPANHALPSVYSEHVLHWSLSVINQVHPLHAL